MELIVHEVDGRAAAVVVAVDPYSVVWYDGYDDGRPRVAFTPRWELPVDGEMVAVVLLPSCFGGWWVITATCYTKERQLGLALQDEDKL